MGRPQTITLYDAHDRPIQLARRIVGQVASGVPMFGGMFNFDDAPELRDTGQRHETFRKMVQQDAYISETIRTNTLPLLSRATWKVDAADKPGRDQTPTPEQKLAIEQAELVSANLYQGIGDTFGRKFWAETSFSQRLREALKFLEHGFAVFHKQWKVVDGKRVFRRLLWLEPSSIWSWKTGAGDKFEGIKRRYMRPDNSWVTDEFLPADELALYVWDMVGARYQSEPLIRPMFGPWKRKDFLLKCKMIAMQRAGVGIPYAVRDAAKDEGDTGEVSGLIEDFLQSSLGSGLESAYLSVANPTLEFRYFGQDPTQAAKWDKAVSGEDLAIAHGGSTKAGMLGELPGGARAVGEVQQALQFVLTTAIGQIFIEQDQYGVSGTTGPVEDLIRVNWSDTETLPKITVDDIDPGEKTRELPLLYEGIVAGVVKKRPALERKILRRLKFDLTDAEMEEELPTPAGLPGIPAPGGPPAPTPDPASPAPEPGPTPVPPPPPKDPPQQVAAPSRLAAVIAQTTRSVRVRATLVDFINRPDFDGPPAREVGFARPITAFERAVLALGVIQTTMTQGEQRMGSAMRATHRAQIDDIVRRGRGGKITNGTLGGFRRSVPKGSKEQQRRIRETFLSIAGQGRAHATEELERQIDLAAALPADLQPGTVGMGRLVLEHDDDPPEGVGPSSDGLLPPGAAIPIGAAGAAGSGGFAPTFQIEALLGELAGEAAVTATISVDAIWARLTNEAIGEFTRLQRAGVEGAALWDQMEAFLNSLSEGPLDLAGREAATVAYNQGRDVAAKIAAGGGQATHAMRDEILDGATCPQCRLFDGTIVLIGSPAYESLLPPAFCLGRDRCRGIIVLLSTALAAALQPADFIGPGAPTDLVIDDLIGR